LLARATTGQPAVATRYFRMDSKKGVVETWLGFLSADEKNAANSVYSGRVEIE